MRYVVPGLVKKSLPEGWDALAKTARDDVAAAQPKDRGDVVNKHSAVWRDLKETLKQVSSGKCWYCESVDLRSDNAVDHYRPKNAVAECLDHGGYWWLAFEWDNYRFSCTFCNSRRIDQETGIGGGKADHFPLWEEGRRATGPADDLRNEEPLLLDPTASADPGLLWFDETGLATPHPDCCSNEDGYAYRRARTSIRLYHLNHTDIVERRKTLCAELRDAVDRADRYFQKYDGGDGTAREAFEDAVRALRKSLSDDEPYSATARAMLMGLRGAHPVVEVVLAAS